MRNRENKVFWVLVVLSVSIFGFLRTVVPVFARLCTDFDCTSEINLPIPACDASVTCNCEEASGECGSQPADQCITSGSDAWTYRYSPVCARPGEDDFGDCEAEWYWNWNECSASDRCSGGVNQPGACVEDYVSGTDTDGVILPGLCAAGTCPDTGCQVGNWYKTCCVFRDEDGSGGPSIGDELTGARSTAGR